MNRTELPRAPIASRLQSLAAAAVVTLVMLSGIDTLTLSETSNALLSQSTAAAQRA